MFEVGISLKISYFGVYQCKLKILFSSFGQIWALSCSFELVVVITFSQLNYSFGSFVVWLLVVVGLWQLFEKEQMLRKEEEMKEEWELGEEKEE